MTKSSYKTVEQVLRDVLRNRQPEFQYVSEDTFPFLLLITSTDVAGFVVLDGEANAAFSSAYTRFKQLYRDQHDEWQQKTLSLVLCATDSSDVQTTLLSEMETDVYFCKKYAIRYSDSVEQLRTEITHLPFIPLPEGKPGGIIRPLSAQTLLQQMGVEASLARQIIVPREYAAYHLVNDVLDGKRKLSLPLKFPTLTVDRDPHIPNTTRVTSIVIKGFRAYKEQREFDLDADLIVLFGPNGLGKTSFFDAVDFACTGRIGRFCRGRVDRQRFVDLSRHLDTEPDFGTVSLKATCQEEQIELRRDVKEWNRAFIDGDSLDRTGVLQRLTSARWPDKTPRIENIERLFRATHLFSQTDPELLFSFSQNSIITADLVSRMLALDDYASGLAKMEEIIDLTAKKLVDLRRASEELSVEKENLSEILRELGSDHKEESPTKTARRVASEIRSLTNTEGMRLPRGNLTSELARDWRAVLQGAIESIEKDIQTSIYILQQLPRIHTLEKQLKKWTDSIQGLTAETEGNRIAIAKLAQSEGITKSKLVELQRETNRIKDVRSSITEARSRRDQVPSLSKERAGLNEQITVLESGLQEKALHIKTLENTIAVCIKKIHKLGTSLSRQTVREDELNTLLSATEKWMSNCRNLTEMKGALKSLSEQRKELIRQCDAKEQELEKARGELRSVEKGYRELAVGVSELTELLDQIERFVTTNLCPVCGAEHMTMDEVITKIRNRKQQRSETVEKAAKAAAQMKTTCANLQQSLNGLLVQKSELEQLLKEKSKESESLSRQITSYENEAVTAGFDPKSTSYVKEIEQAHTNALSDVHDTTEAMAIKKKTRDAAVSEKESLVETQENVFVELGKKRKRVEDLSLKLQDIERAIAEIGIKTTTSDEEIDNMLQEQNKKLVDVEKQLSGLSTSLSSHQADISKLENKQNEITTLQKSLEKQRVDGLKEVRSFRKQHHATDLPDPVTPEQINAKIAELTERQNRLETVSEKIRFLEKLIDSAARSAEIADIESHFKKADIRDRNLRSKMSLLTDARKWFQKAQDGLRVQRERAVDSHIAAYGPLASVIQSRLRAVYGFGPIKLESRKDEIHVTVSRASEFVRPTDYFSESQKQILMISLFLAGRLTQTWSGFAPILLDDPVTHFDDLNAYCFVELLRGLLEDERAARQFFISTCEERLFSLMRQKLGSLSGGVRFYQFRAMTPEGPEIVPVPG